MEFQNTLLAREQDILDRNLRDWLQAHTSFLKPLHRYVGNLSVGDSGLAFQGLDKKEAGSLRLSIPYDRIEEVHLGFDEVFKRREDRQLGLMGFVPLCVSYRDHGRKERIYLFAAFHHNRIGARASRNDELYPLLQSPPVSLAR